MFEVRREADVATLARPGTTWLSTGWKGGRREASAAHWLSVPEGWDPGDLSADVAERLADVGIDRTDEPVLLTGVSLDHLRAARCGPAVAYATAGLSNPAALPMAPSGGDLPGRDDLPDGGDGFDHDRAGTVNVAVGTPLTLDPGALANLVAVAAEAKAATLLHHAGVPGTTTDAVLVACDASSREVSRSASSTCDLSTRGDSTIIAGDPPGAVADLPRPFSGSATRIGAAARACVREVITAALGARYEDRSMPASVADADHGVTTDVRAEVYDPLCGEGTE